MFCSNCGAQLPDGSTFCNKCGTRISARADGLVGQQAGNTGNIAGNMPGNRGVSHGMNNRAGGANGRNAGTGSIAPRGNLTAHDTSGSGKKKSKLGLIAGVGVVAVLVIGGAKVVSNINNAHDIIFDMEYVPGKGQNSSNSEKTYADSKVRHVDGSQTGSKAAEIDPDADSVQDLKGLADRLAESGNSDAAEAVYAMIPKAALAQAGQDELERIEESPSGPESIYFIYNEAKDMYKSIFGKK